MTLNLDKLARPEILALAPYRSARGEVADTGGMLLLDANENPFAGPGGGRPNRYPEPQPAKLAARLARHYGVDVGNILMTRGSDEGIDLLVRAFCRPGQDAVLTCPPTFGFYAVAAAVQGAEVIEVPLDETGGLDFDGIVAAGAFDSAKLIFLCSPNNPTGAAMDRETMLLLARRLPECLVVIDEAYIEFSDNESLAPLIAEQPNLVVLRTLSKAFGLAGIRFGTLIGDPALVALLRRILAPYPVPVPVAEAALAALEPAGLARLEYEVGRLRAARDEMAQALAGLSGVIEVLPSAANFLLVRFKDAAATKARLAARGILVRDFSAKIEGALRISIGTEADDALLLGALGANNGPANASRRGECARTSRETSIFAAVDLDRNAAPSVATGVGFFDHMLEQLGKHGGFALTLKCTGDLEVDAHHTVEDCMIALGTALRQALGDKAGLARYGFTVPMDEARAEAVIDLSGRAAFRFEGDFAGPAIGELPTEMVPHIFQSLAESLGAAIHIRVDGENDHHKAEACFKAVGRALKSAFRREGAEIPSTKGFL